jgi:GT2 family glycosyltransferase
MASVTVIVPCYRYGAYVTDCVRSVLANQEVDLDVLVIDDCSPDDTWETVRRLPELDRRIRVQRNSVNLGLIGTANVGIDAVTSDYVVLLSADDLLAPGWLDRGIAQLEAHPEASFAYGLTCLFTDAVPDPAGWAPTSVAVYSGHEWIKQRCAAGLPDIMSPETIVRSKAQLTVGGYNPALPHSSDAEMWLRLASVGDVIQVSGSTAAYYRVHDAAMSSAIRASMLNELTVCRDAFEAWHSFAGDLVPDRDALLATARAGLARRAVRRALVAFLQDPSDQNEFLALCDLAMECDPTTGGRVGQLRRLHAGRAARRFAHALRPATIGLIRGMRALNHFRQRLQGRFSVA